MEYVFQNQIASEDFVGGEFILHEAGYDLLDFLAEVDPALPFYHLGEGIRLVTSPCVDGGQSWEILTERRGHGVVHAGTEWHG